MEEERIEEIGDDVSTYLALAMDSCFEKLTLESGEQVRPEVREEELLSFVENLVVRAKTLGWKADEMYGDVYDHIIIGDDFHDILIFGKRISGHYFFWEISPLMQTTKSVKDQEILSYEPEARFFLKKRSDLSPSFSEIPEEKRRIIIEEAQTIGYAISSVGKEKFDEDFYQRLRSQLYKEVPELKEMPELKGKVKGILEKPIHVISCPVSKQAVKYVNEKNKFDFELFKKGFKKTIKETVKRHPTIGNLYPMLEKKCEKDGFLAKISLIDIELDGVSRNRIHELIQRGKGEEKGTIYVLYDGKNIDFILPQGEFSEKLSKAITAYNGALNWMFYKFQEPYSANIRDLCMRSSPFSNMVQEEILGKIRKNLEILGIGNKYSGFPEYLQIQPRIRLVEQKT